MTKKRVAQMGNHMAIAKREAIGVGHVSVGMRICPRCNDTRFSATHKSKCRVNPNAVWG